MAGLQQVEDAENLKVAQAAELRTIWLGMDQGRTQLRSSDVKGRSPFNDERVRRAMYHAIDIDAIRENVMLGYSKPAGMLVPPGIEGYAPELDQRLPYDPETATALLLDAGYPDGFTVTLDCPNNRFINGEAICRALAAQFKAVGIDVAVNVQSFELHLDLWMDSLSPFPGGSPYVFAQFYHSQGHGIRPVTQTRQWMS